MKQEMIYFGTELLERPKDCEIYYQMDSTSASLNFWWLTIIYFKKVKGFVSQESLPKCKKLIIESKGKRRLSSLLF